jgi:hypothetical protein
VRGADDPIAQGEVLELEGLEQGIQGLCAHDRSSELCI